jgi:sensor histidine kinase YesM
VSLAASDTESQEPAPIRFWLSSLACWSLLALILATQSFVAKREEGYIESFGPLLARQAVSAYTWALLQGLVFAAARRVHTSQRSWWRYLVHLPLALVCALLHIVAFSALLEVLGLADSSYITAVRWYITNGVATRVQTYAAIVLVYHLLDHYQRVRASEVASARLAALHAEARLAALHARLEPHFLFNALNGAVALVRERPRDAERMLTRLGELLRLTMSLGTERQVPLRQELCILEAYLDVQRARFGDRLTITLDVAPEALECLVPTLLLQPLAENAIRHGLEPRNAPGRLEVRAATRGDRLALSVEDDGIGRRDGSPAGDGLGLSLTAARLQQLYGDEQSLALEPGRLGGTKASVTLPARRTCRP